MTTRKKSNNIRLINFKGVIGLNIKYELIISSGNVTLKEHVKPASNDFKIDCKDCIISPGFIDPQVNGMGSCSFWDITKQSFNEIDNIRLKLAYCGIVAFCPTIITGPIEKIISSIDYINSYIKQAKEEDGSQILGIHIEGIFITKYGIHDSKYIQNELIVKNIEPLIKENVILFTLAPELDKTGEVIKLLQKNNILVSIGHSNSTYRQGLYAINELGLNTVTHMFNALRGCDGFNHRGNGTTSLNILKEKLENEKNIDPDKDGIMLALLKNRNVLCMVIADGIHVNKEVIKLLREYKDPAHFSLATDIVSKDFYDHNILHGKLGGGQSTLDICVSNLIKWKVSNIEDCLTFASKPFSNKLKNTKQQGLGEIKIGQKANITIWDTKNNAVKGTIIGENIFLN